MTQRYRLKLKKLDFISPVDEPAQETAKVKLLKKKGKVAGNVEGFARVAKIDDELGLVFCWAFTTKAEGDDYYDLHGDCIDEDFVKCAMEFMEGARATDEMHDRESDGQVVFAMPMTSEIAKAFGVETDTVGLMVALKPSEEVFAKFKSGDYTGVSIDGLGIREKVEKATPVATRKRAALTTAVNGHTHLLYGIDDMQSGTTSYEYMDPTGDYRSGHSHPWVRDDAGEILIGEALGHTHEVATKSVDASKRSKSTTANVIPTVKTKDANMSNTPDLSKQLDEVTKRAERAERIAKMSGVHKTHFDTLAGDDAEVFLAKSTSEREAIVKAARDADAALGEVIYTSLAGETFTKRDDARLVTAVKRADEGTRNLETERLEKRAATEFAGLGEPAVIVDILKGAKALDDKRREAVEQLLKGAKAAFDQLAKMQGVDPGTAPKADSPEAQLDALTKKIATEQKVDIVKAETLALDTIEGKALYATISKNRRARNGATA